MNSIISFILAILTIISMNPTALTYDEQVQLVISTLAIADIDDDTNTVIIEDATGNQWEFEYTPTEITTKTTNSISINASYSEIIENVISTIDILEINHSSLLIIDGSENIWEFEYIFE